MFSQILDFDKIIKTFIKYHKVFLKENTTRFSTNFKFKNFHKKKKKTRQVFRKFAKIFTRKQISKKNKKVFLKKPDKVFNNFQVQKKKKLPTHFGSEIL